MSDNIHIINLSSYQTPLIQESKRDTWVEFGEDKEYWLVVYATGANDLLLTLGTIRLTLAYDNISQVTPAPPEPALILAFRTIAVAGQSSIVADTSADTLTIVAGNGITLETDAATDTLTITAAGGAGSGDVTGPASATDNAITRFNGTTGKIIQNSGATLSDTGGILADTLAISTTPTGAGGTGIFRYDTGEKVPEVGIDGITLKMGVQEYVRVYNDTGVVMTKGQVVYISGAQGNRVAVKLADATSEVTSKGTIGIVAQQILADTEGFVQTTGPMYNLNTIGLTAGNVLFLSETEGEWTATEPAPPAHGVRLAYVERVHATAGSVYIKIDNGYELGELHNVSDSAVGITAFLTKNSSTNVWTSRTATEARGDLGLGTLATQNGTFSGTSSGTNTGDQTITLTGDVTGSGTGSFAATIASNAVTYAKMQAVSAASRLIGRGTAGTTAVREISLGTGLSMSGDVLSATVTGIGGSAGLVDNGIVVADGTGGSTVKGSVVSIDSSSGVVSNLTQIRADSSNHSLILSPNGTGALIVGPRPDGGATGGNARGANAVDLQFARTSATNVASGQESFIGGGTNNRASGTQSFKCRLSACCW